jgi:hypothetical protein
MDGGAMTLKRAVGVHGLEELRLRLADKREAAMSGGGDRDRSPIGCLTVCRL